MRTRHEIRIAPGREIALALLLKALALVVLFLLFFAPWHHPEISPEAVRTQLGSVAPVAEDGL